MTLYCKIKLWSFKVEFICYIITSNDEIQPNKVYVISD